MLGKPNPGPQDRYFIEFYNKDQNLKTDEPECWQYFETEDQWKKSGYESRRDAQGRPYAGIYLFRGVSGGGWDLCCRPCAAPSRIDADTLVPYL